MHERHTNERLHSPLPTTNVFCVPKKATTNSIGNLIKLIADWLCDRPNIWFLFLSGFFFYTAQFFFCWRMFFLVSVVFLPFADLIFYWQIGGFLYTEVSSTPERWPTYHHTSIKDTGSPVEDYPRLNAFEALDLRRLTNLIERGNQFAAYL